jgi:hypothetical protein
VLDSGATQRGFEASVPVDGIWAEHAYNQQYAAPYIKADLTPL